jgi:drug/metabolite transporter (DMT)-like permease
MAIAFVLFGETLSPLAIVGVVVVLVGLYFLAAPSGPLFTGLSLKKPGEKRGMVLLLLAIIAWGVSTVVIRVTTKDLDPVVANLVRMAGTAAVLAPFAVAQRRKAAAKVSWGSAGAAVANGAISFGFGGILFLFALQKSGASLTSVLTSTSPVFLLPMSVFFLKEKVTGKLVLGAALSVLGICLTFLPQIIGG